jgi:hypothetical protein
LRLAGCKVDDHPISPVAGAGGPRCGRAARRATSYVHIGPQHSLGDAAAANGRLAIVVVDHKPAVTEDEYVAHVSRVGRQRYLNVVQTEDGKPAGYLFVRYTLLDRDTLQFATIDADALKAAIAAGRIKGTVRGEGLSSETTITAGSDECAFRAGGRHVVREALRPEARPVGI